MNLKKLLGAITMAATLTACPGGSPPSGKVTSSYMVGVWQVVEITNQGGSGVNLNVKASDDGSLKFSPSPKKVMKAFATFAEKSFKFTVISVNDKKFNESVGSYSLDNGNLVATDEKKKNQAQERPVTTVRLKGNLVEIASDYGKDNRSITLLKKSSQSALNNAISGMTRTNESDVFSVPSKGEFTVSLKSEKSGSEVEFSKSIRSSEPDESYVNCSIQNDGVTLITMSSRASWDEESDAFVYLEVAQFPKIREPTFSNIRFTFKPDEKNTVWASGKLLKKLEIFSVDSKPGLTECKMEASKKSDVLTGSFECGGITAFASKESSSMKGLIKGSFECGLQDNSNSNVK